MISRWPVLQHHQVTKHDVIDGCISRQALEAWAWSAREYYLSQNHELHGLLGHGVHLDYEIQNVKEACLRIGSPKEVAVSVGVGEVRTDSFVLNTRIRALGVKGDVAVTVPTVVRLVNDDGAIQPIDRAVRDAMIVLEQDAQHYN